MQISKHKRSAVAVVISPNYKDYAKRFLPDCIKSLRKQTYAGKMKIFIADNESSDESFSFLKKNAPEIDIIRNEDNAGFAKGNNVCMEKALKEGFDHIILFNMDTEVDDNCVEELVKKAVSDSKAGSVQARLMVHGQKGVVNSLGNSTHFLGFGYCLGYGEQYEEYKNDDAKINIMYPSGAAVLLKKEALEKVGLFDERFWMYNEDQELGWRLLLAGYDNVLAKRAVVRHKYEFARSRKQFYWMDRNRILSILFCYHWLTLMLILPAFVVMEMGLVLFSLKSGWFKEKLKVWGFILWPKNWVYIAKRRKQDQALRRVSDRSISELITGRIWYQEVDDRKLRLVNPIFDLYWKVAKKLIVW